MKTRLQNHFAILLKGSLVTAVVSAHPLCCPAQELRLTIERSQIADGFITEVVQGPGGTVVVSGDYWPGLVPHIAVLDGAGTVLKRLNPPSISASLHWGVRAVLADGSYIVDDDWLPRFHLSGDGTPIFHGIALPTGPVVVQKSGAVLFGRSANDDTVGAAIERWRFDVEPPQYDTAFAGSVYQAWPVPFLKCAQMAITEDDRIWAWLAVPGDTHARLFRFLSDGRSDPSFQPSQPIESYGAPFFSGESAIATWLGPLTNGGLMVVQANDQGSPAMRRLLPDGTTDASFAWPFNDAVTIYPLVTFPDGSLLVNIYGDPSQLAGLLKVTPNGALDPTWQSQLPPASPEIGKVVCQSDGRLVVLHGSPFHGGVRLHRLSRLNPDGSLDSTFDGSVVSPNPVPAVRVRVSGLVPGQLYSLEERNGTESTAKLTGEVQFFSEPNQRQPVELVDRLVSADVRRFWTLRPVSQP